MRLHLHRWVEVEHWPEPPPPAPSGSFTVASDWERWVYGRTIYRHRCRRCGAERWVARVVRPPRGRPTTPNPEVTTSPHEFYPLARRDRRTGERCRSCVLPAWRHPTTGWVESRAIGDKTIYRGAEPDTEPTDG